MPTTLLTGANGFLATTILDELISSGHTVVGSVRSAAKGQQILDSNPSYKGKLSFEVVSDYTKDVVWDQTFQKHSFDYVIHTAAPVFDNPANTDFERDYLKPSVSGNREILKSASKYGKTVKAIAVTSSLNAITLGSDLATRRLNSSEWLPFTIADAAAAQNPYLSYAVGKAEAEKAIWEYVKTAIPHYTVSVLLPALIFGPSLPPATNLKKINFSTDIFYCLMNGTYEVTPPTMFPSYIDVRDLSHAHILSLTTPAVANQRFLVGGLRYTSQLAVDSIRAAVPSLASRLPKASSEEPPIANLEDVKEWNEKLGLKLRTPEETFGDSAKRMLELEGLWGPGESENGGAGKEVRGFQL